MDSRDIQEKPPIIKDGSHLEKIYELQKELIDKYIQIEHSVGYPVNVNTKQNQNLLKDFTGRVIEELAEGYEALLQVEELTIKNKLWFGDINDEDLLMMSNHLQNVSEEMADALHFMVELLIYANIQPEDIQSWMESQTEDYERWVKPLLTSREVDHFGILKESMAFGKYWLLSTNLLIQYDLNQFNMVDLHGVLAKYAKDKSNEEEGNIIKFPWKLLTCGRMYSKELYHIYKSYLWDVTYHLNIARNFLKNKPWKQSQVLTNESAYQAELVKAFIKLVGTMYLMGIDTASGLFYIYFKKNRVNAFRQASKY